MFKRKKHKGKIHNGTTLKTRDEYLYSGKDYRKPGYENKGHYRKVVVVDVDFKKENLAVVKLTTKKPNTKPLPGYRDGRSEYKPHVETLDNEGKPIRTGKKFLKNSKAHDVGKHNIAVIKKDCFKDSKQSARNRKRVRKMKGRL